MAISKEGQEITLRFFEAITMLKEKKVIRGLQTFTRRYGINTWNLSTLRKEYETRMLKPEYLMYLVRDYEMSAKWLLTGEGHPFKKTTVTMITEE